MKNFMFRFSGLIAIALIFAAKVTPMCAFFHYQPEVPASLRK
jgi:cyclic lactone autoinducer peptide